MGAETPRGGRYLVEPRGVEAAHGAGADEEYIHGGIPEPMASV